MCICEKSEIIIIMYGIKVIKEKKRWRNYNYTTNLFQFSIFFFNLIGFEIKRQLKLTIKLVPFFFYCKKANRALVLTTALYENGQIAAVVKADV